jgi:hypothetical protein
MPDAMVSLANITLGSAVSSVSFGSIPATFRDLRLVAQYKDTTDGVQGIIRINGDSGSNYANTGMSGYSSVSAGSWSNTAARVQAIAYTGVATADFCFLETDFFDYAQTNKQKSILSRSSHPGEVGATVSRWANTAAITSIVVLPEAGNFAVGSNFCLYGVVA